MARVSLGNRLSLTLSFFLFHPAIALFLSLFLGVCSGQRVVVGRAASNKNAGPDAEVRRRCNAGKMAGDRSPAPKGTTPSPRAVPLRFPDNLPARTLPRTRVRGAVCFAASLQPPPPPTAVSVPVSFRTVLLYHYPGETTAV